MVRQHSPAKRALMVAALFVLIAARDGLTAERPPLEMIQTIELKGRAGRLDHLALDAKNRRLFVANMANSTLDIVDLKGGKLLKQVPGQQGIQGIAYAQDLDRIFVGLGTGGFCNIFDGKDYKLLKTIKFKDDADNVRYDPRTHLVYVAHAEKSLAVIDAKTFAVRADLKLPGPPEAFQLETGRQRLYLNTPSPSQVVVIDLEKQAIIARHPLQLAIANYPLALDEANRRLLVGCRREPSLVVLNSDTGEEVASVPIPADIDDLFFDPKRKRIYASCGEGFLAVIRQKDADHYDLSAKIPTVKGARTSLFDAQTSHLYLAVPRQAGQDGPEIRVYQARP